MPAKEVTPVSRFLATAATAVTVYYTIGWYMAGNEKFSADAIYQLPVGSLAGDLLSFVIKAGASLFSSAAVWGAIKVWGPYLLKLLDALNGKGTIPDIPLPPDVVDPSIGKLWGYQLTEIGYLKPIYVKTDVKPVADPVVKQTKTAVKRATK